MNAEHTNLPVPTEAKHDDKPDDTASPAGSSRASTTADTKQRRGDNREQQGDQSANKNGDQDGGKDGGKDGKPQPKPKAAPKPVSEAKVAQRKRLPALVDDADVGVEEPQIVTRDGKADLGFTGTLLASAAPASCAKEEWQEYRVYKTNGGKHVFSKVTRTVLQDKDDTYDAEVYDPSPSSVPTQLLRSARELARSRPLTWMDAAVAFFGYDPLAKALYRKLSVGFEEQIT